MRRLAVDLNYLFLRQQMERSLAAAAENAAARAAHEGMARQYELEIERKSGGQIVFAWHGQHATAEQRISARPSPTASS
jgi:hypothetical protein